MSMSESNPVLNTAEPALKQMLEGDSLRVVDVSALLKMHFPPREGLLGNVFTLKSLNMVYACRGVGKTHFALGAAYAIAAGSSFFGWEAKRPAKVLYIDGEMPGNSLQERLKSIVKTADKHPQDDFLKFLTIDMNHGKMPDISTTEGQESIEEACQDAEVIVLDNLSCLARSGRENEAESWTIISEWAMRMRSQGKCVIFIHHAGKDGQQRGTSKREDILDVVINLKHPVDYEASEGARFVVEFQKARHLQGDEVKPFEARLVTGTWHVKDAEVSNFEKVVELTNEGLNQKEISEELELNKSTVSRHQKNARNKGLITE
jgi:predicted ATP-dependent serine protease